MNEPHYVSIPDAHLNPEVAEAYDRTDGGRFSVEEIGSTVEFLRNLAGEGPAVEFAVGTGRIAIPLAQTGVLVHGIDFSAPMLAQMRSKPGAKQLNVVQGDMTTTQVCEDACLVYLVFNTIMNLRTQEQQVACFRNAAAHLASGGSFVVETGVPELRHLAPGETIRPFDLSPDHLGFDEYVDLVNQISVSHHYFIDNGRVRTSSPAFRYVWPSELDLMAQLADMRLTDRWANWAKEPFTGDSRFHVSVWEKM